MVGGLSAVAAYIYAGSDQYFSGFFKTLLSFGPILFTVGQQCQTFFNRCGNVEQLAVFGADEICLGSLINKIDQPIIISIDIVNDDWFLMQAQLRPGDNFHQLLKGAKTTGKSNKSV